MSDLLGALHAQGQAIADSPVTPQALADLLALVAAGDISGKIAKDIFPEMLETGKAAAAIVEEKGLKQVSDSGELQAVLEKIFADNPGEVEAYRGGKKKLMGFFVGQVMKATKGQANPQTVNELVNKLLGA